MFHIRQGYAPIGPDGPQPQPDALCIITGAEYIGGAAHGEHGGGHAGRQQIDGQVKQ
ncbi:MAG: hypothetical protein U0872_13630 [Planctomycetaceae bacterium]